MTVIKAGTGEPMTFATTPTSTPAPETATTPTVALSKKKPFRHYTPVKPQPPLIDLNQPGRLHVANLLALYGLKSTSRLYEKIGLNQIPQPDGRDGRRPFWKTSTIRQHLEG